jgi:hypothetical protein
LALKNQVGIKFFLLSIFFIYCINLHTLRNMKWQKKYTAQGFYIENKFESLCVVTLGDGGISFSFVVVRRREIISHFSYGIRTTPRKILYINSVSLSVRLSEWTEPHFFQDEAPFLHSSKIHKEVLRCSSLHKHTHINFLLYVRLSVCDGGFGGWERQRLVKQWATTTISAPARCTNQDLISTKHCSCPKGRNDGRIASLSHCTRGGYKNLPLPPPTTERIDDYMEERVFGNFQNFREPRFKMSEPGFWVFSPSSGKGVNTWTDNLRVHTVGSDTCTTLVGTTALSHNIVFICGDINALGWDPRVLFWENFRLWW